eukprot:TRINITY_DN81849_c0_g1_i1.p1 TRINITY_DN81849_c0_g1~~TRINITY_DN81849_c0_g1_i1.p1  ORF type:complete len:498 (+),score=37.71 TRINITY_DN81849_c0_g1_i1:86-1495(+)
MSRGVSRASTERTPLRPLLCLWKSRLPLIAGPVLAGLRQLPRSEVDVAGIGTLSDVQSEGVYLQSIQVAILAAIATFTGYHRIPFSVTWWMVLLAAFALKMQLLLGAATVLSLSVLLGWYGARILHPQAVSALWGSLPGKSPGTVARICWEAWDLCIHLVPGLLMLYWHGLPDRETVTLGAVAASLPLNILWLLGLRCSLENDELDNDRGVWPSALRLDLEDTNLVYGVANLPRFIWYWVYGSHLAICILWAALISLPLGALAAFAIFIGIGLIGLPYTTGWWCLFLTALYQGGGGPRLRTFEVSHDVLLIEGVACCCAATTSLGFYGAQVLAPYAFASLIESWVLVPSDRFLPKSWSQKLREWSRLRSFWLALRAGDCFVHLLPTSLAIFLFSPSLSSLCPLVSLPTNLLWLAATGSTSLSSTSQLYGVDPPLKSHVLHFIYGSHWMLCAVASYCLSLERAPQALFAF